ncbi:MAG: DUF417 domain-containing protein [Planctomycetaceae bacterium]|nr:MAG: DUF417 domain-containing protein [Planctomycetaceae bacterium]
MSLQRVLQWAADTDRIGYAVTRLGLVVVLVWIGGLKVTRYEADGIVPFVANSPLMSFFYSDPGGYAEHMNPEGAVNTENRAWHERNGTYPFAWALGSVIVAYGVMIALNPWFPTVATLGSFLVFVMSLTTLSFLVTTPESWVPNLGDTTHGFPYLSGRGRLVIKDAIMMGAALATMADSAKAALKRSAEPIPAE